MRITLINDIDNKMYTLLHNTFYDTLKSQVSPWSLLYPYKIYYYYYVFVQFGKINSFLSYLTIRYHVTNVDTITPFWWAMFCI